jgi:hypothetical protein
MGGTVKPIHSGNLSRTFCEEHYVFHGFYMESNLYTTETVYNERTLSARTNFCPEEPVYNELSLSTFFCSQVKNQVLGIQNNISED